MSQEKVDRRKYEKKNRKMLERKRKIRTAVKCVIAALVIGALIGVPTGIKIYKDMPKFVGDQTLGNFVANYIDENYAADIAGLGQTTEDAGEDSAEDELTKALEDNIDGLEKVDEDNIDEILGIGDDSEDNSEQEDTEAEATEE